MTKHRQTVRVNKWEYHWPHRPRHIADFFTLKTFEDELLAWNKTRAYDDVEERKRVLRQILHGLTPGYDPQHVYPLDSRPGRA